jgi:BCD family chlorophyll transporter-like MFS transporter
MCLGAIVVLTTSTLNRLMVVELALPAVLPGLLVALHYGIQITRPNWGFLSDTGGQAHPLDHRRHGGAGPGRLRRGRGVCGAVRDSFGAGLALSIARLCADRWASAPRAPRCWRFWPRRRRPRRRAAAATITWLMMIAGIAVTAGHRGRASRPLYARAADAHRGLRHRRRGVLTTLAVWGIERRVSMPARGRRHAVLDGLREVWAEPPRAISRSSCSCR